MEGLSTPTFFVLAALAAAATMVVQYTVSADDADYAEAAKAASVRLRIGRESAAELPFVLLAVGSGVALVAGLVGLRSVASDSATDLALAIGVPAWVVALALGWRWLRRRAAVAELAVDAAGLRLTAPGEPSFELRWAEPFTVEVARELVQSRHAVSTCEVWTFILADGRALHLSRRLPGPRADGPCGVLPPSDVRWQVPAGAAATFDRIVAFSAEAG